MSDGIPPSMALLLLALIVLVLAALGFGIYAVVNQRRITDLAEQAADDADRADRKVDDLVEALAGDDSPSGRHARRVA